ncbi:MAG: hypothetical protein RMI34_08520 [Chloroherpetonaceae bacterium]|nr:hypothetical protein [Chloroherpetonaceae bacterium]MDW8020102.1 hypothetical protein [Chloroherpetonaceae bacterium]
MSMCRNLSWFIFVITLLSGCVLADSVRQPRPIRIACEGSRLDLYQKAKEVLERQQYKIRVDNRLDGILKAYRRPEQVNFGDQIMFNGALYVMATIDSAVITLYIYRILDIPAEEQEPVIEVSYDERNASVFTRSLYQPLIDEMRRSCAQPK